MRDCRAAHQQERVGRGNRRAHDASDGDRTEPRRAGEIRHEGHERWKRLIRRVGHLRPHEHPRGRAKVQVPVQQKDHEERIGDRQRDAGDARISRREHLRDHRDPCRVADQPHQPPRDQVCPGPCRAADARPPGGHFVRAHQYRRQAAHGAVHRRQDREQSGPHQDEQENVGPDNRQKAAERDEENKDGRAGRHTCDERHAEEPLEEEAHHADLSDHVQHARHADDHGAVAAEKVALESRAHVIGQREAGHHPQLFREVPHDDERGDGEADERERGHTAKPRGEGDTALHGSAVEHGRDLGDDHQADAEPTAGHPEILRRTLMPRREEPDRDEQRHVEREDNDADAAEAAQVHRKLNRGGRCRSASSNRIGRRPPRRARR